MEVLTMMPRLQSGKFARLFSLRNVLTGLCLMLLFWMTAKADVAPRQSYLVLCYHSISSLPNGDPDGISAEKLSEQLAWLRNRGYKAISMSDVLQAKAGGKPLPALSFMLTVDDGFLDFYTNAFPILKLHKVPAVFGLVGRWIEEPTILQNQTDPYFSKQRFVTWAQVKEMSDSGLVEMASHSYDLHHGILSNPQENLRPAAVTIQYDLASRSYETPEQHRLRVRTDLQKNSALIEKHTGKAPRIMVWPYGAMDRVGVEEAERAGMPINLTLLDGLASTSDTQAVARTLVGEDMPLKTFSHMVQFGHLRKSGDPVRGIKVSLDRIYDPDPVKQDQKLGRLIDQAVRLGVNMVVLQPFAAHPDGSVREVYFPNSVMPMRTDLLDRVAWQLRNRVEVDVFMQIETARLTRLENGTLRTLEPKNAQDRKQLITLFGDLSRHSTAQGLLFDGLEGDAAQTGFNQELIQGMTYYRLPTLSNYVEGVSQGQRALYGEPADLTADARYGRYANATPARATPAELDALVRTMAPEKVHLLTLPVKGASVRELEAVVANVRFYKHRGLPDFLLDGDDFFDDPAKFELVRRAVSLKDNPFASLAR
jgi:poly-beta-1,6-N-acetyl-D-glucosamine N-deacetylase PgaB